MKNKKKKAIKRKALDKNGNGREVESERLKEREEKERNNETT
jgi:hypothetical protein